MQSTRTVHTDPGTLGVVSTAPVAQAPSATPAAGTISGATATAAAHHAVEVVARIADGQATRAGSADAVSFGLRLGSENLTVRVELKAGEVRTQISTDSADLKSAIAGAWAGLDAAAEGKSYHFAAPDFSGGGGMPGEEGTDNGEGFRDPGQFQQTATRPEDREPPSPAPEAARVPASTTSTRLQAVA